MVFAIVSCLCFIWFRGFFFHLNPQPMHFFHFFPIFLNFAPESVQVLPFLPWTFPHHFVCQSITRVWIQLSCHSGASHVHHIGLLLAALFQTDSPKLLPTESTVLLKQISLPLHATFKAVIIIWSEFNQNALLAFFNRTICQTATVANNMITCTFCCLLPPAG